MKPWLAMAAHSDLRPRASVLRFSSLSFDQEHMQNAVADGNSILFFFAYCHTTWMDPPTREHHVVNMASSSSSSSSSFAADMAAAGRAASMFDGVPTKEQLLDVARKCATLKLALRQMYSKRSGRYNGVDTARKQCIDTRVVPGLDKGRLPTADDNRALFELGPVATMLPADKKWIDKWRKTSFRDPRQAPAAPPAATQTTILDYFVARNLRCGDAQAAKRGRPRAYVFDWGPYDGFTVEQVLVKTGQFGSFTHGARFIQWICADQNFKWMFPRHLQLFAEVRRIECQCKHSGRFLQDNTGKRWRLTVLQGHVDKYMEFLNSDYWADVAVRFQQLVRLNVVDGDGNRLVQHGWTASANVSEIVAEVRHLLRLNETTSTDAVVEALVERVRAEPEIRIAQTDEQLREGASAAVDDGLGDLGVRAEQAVKDYVRDVGTKLTPQYIEGMRRNNTCVINPPNPFMQALADDDNKFDAAPFHSPKITVVHFGLYRVKTPCARGGFAHSDDTYIRKRRWFGV